MVTGVGIFIGAHAVNELINGNKNVIAFDDLSEGFSDNENHKTIFIEGTVTDHKQDACLIRS